MPIFRLLLCLVLSLMLPGCGGGGTGSIIGDPAKPLSMPTLSGSPLTTVIVGESYLFVPVSADASTFSIVNKPSWATFDPATATLSGTPTNHDAGTWSGITISASNSKGSVALPSFSITVLPSATTAKATLASSAPPEGSLAGLTVTIQLPPGVTPPLGPEGKPAPSAAVPFGNSASQADIPANMMSFTPSGDGSGSTFSFVVVSNSPTGLGGGAFAVANLVVSAQSHPAPDSIVVKELKGINLYGEIVTTVNPSVSVEFQ